MTVAILYTQKLELFFFFGLVIVVASCKKIVSEVSSLNFVGAIDIYLKSHRFLFPRGTLYVSLEFFKRFLLTSCPSVDQTDVLSLLHT